MHPVSQKLKSPICSFQVLVISCHGKQNLNHCLNIAVKPKAEKVLKKNYATDQAIKNLVQWYVQIIGQVFHFGFWHLLICGLESLPWCCTVVAQRWASLAHESLAILNNYKCSLAQLVTVKLFFDVKFCQNLNQTKGCCHFWCKSSLIPQLKHLVFLLK